MKKMIFIIGFICFCLLGNSGIYDYQNLEIIISPDFGPLDTFFIECSNVSIVISKDILKKIEEKNHYSKVILIDALSNETYLGDIRDEEEIIRATLTKKLKVFLNINYSYNKAQNYWFYEIEVMCLGAEPIIDFGDDFWEINLPVDKTNPATKKKIFLSKSIFEKNLSFKSLI